MKRIISLVVLLAVAVTFAGEAVNNEEMVKQDVRLVKREIIAANIVIEDEAKAKRFWELYDEYEKALKPVTDKYVALLKKFAGSYEDLTAEKANSIVAENFSITAERAKILKKTHKKMAKEVSAIDAALLVQIENRIWLMVQFDAAMALPLIMPEKDMN